RGRGSEPGETTGGQGLESDNLRLVVRHCGHLRDWSKCEEITERTVRRSGLRSAHLFKNLVAKQRRSLSARRRGHVRVAAHAINSERAPGLPFEQSKALRLFDRQGLQQYGVRHAEQRGVRADPERE